MSRTSVAAVVALLAVAIAVGAIAATPVAAAPDPYCGSNGGGATFVADSGFTVEYSDSEPMPASGPFQGDDAIRFRNVTLSSSAATFLRLEDGTGPETCIAAVDATAASIRVDPDGEQAVVIDGQVDALSLADADYGEGSVDLYYEANGPWTLTLQSTGLDEGTEVEAVDGGGSGLATAAVDASGDLALGLPGGTSEVDLRTADGSGSAGAPRIGVTSVQPSASEVGVDETVEVEVTLRNDGNAGGDHTVTLTADGQAVDDATVTVPANAAATVTLSARFGQSGSYDLAVDGQDGGTVTVGGGQSSTDGDDGSGGGGGSDDGSNGDGASDRGLPWLLVGGVAALPLAAGGAYALARRRSGTVPGDSAEDESTSEDDADAADDGSTTGDADDPEGSRSDGETGGSDGGGGGDEQTASDDGEETGRDGSDEPEGDDAAERKSGGSEGAARGDAVGADGEDGT